MEIFGMAEQQESADTLREAYNKGFSAGRDGASFNECPYAAWSDHKGEWIAGHRAASGRPSW